ncbi:MAG: hypothetical protein OXK76_07775 [Gammaproteobacteria bacterium]|nr:hypothetical protein [Gammaproteobacteria bacterium]
MRTTEPKMPTTLPSPVDRGQFDFVALDAAGRAWHWVDSALVWMRVEEEAQADGAAEEPCGVRH